MPQQSIFLLTGATSGVGLEVARALTKPGNKLIIGARRPANARALKSAAPSATVLPLDLASLRSVGEFAAAVRNELREGEGLAAIACNAGIQETLGQSFSEDGFDLTFASNHLGHFLLVHLLLPCLAAGGTVVSTASGTHDPHDGLATRFGFRGGIFLDARHVARGELDTAASTQQQCRDRYATSKLCNILFTMEMARRIPASVARFIALDPGLMPGTGLIREGSAFQRFGWSYLLPTIGPLLPGVSSPARSGAALALVLSEPKVARGTGLHFDYTLKQTPVSADARDPEKAADLYAVSAELCQVPAIARPSRTAAGLTPSFT